MSFRLVAAAWEADIQSPGCKLVLMGLASYANEDGECWPKQETLASRTCQGVRTVRDHLRWLEANGYIQREHRASTSGRRSDMYLVTIKHPQPAKSAACTTGEKPQTQPAKSAACSIEESVITNIPSFGSIIFPIWKKVNAHGKGVKHIAWTPAMERAAKARSKECGSHDFEDVVKYALENMVANPWFSDNPSMMNLEHFLRSANFHRYAGDYAPKAEA